MANSSDSSSQAAPQDERQSAECPPDNKLPENSQDNLDARLDHAINETFPTSDRISVHSTAGPAPERPDQDAPAPSVEAQQDRPEQDPAEQLLDQVRDALQDITDSVSGAASEVYKRSGEYVQQAREQYPEAERYIREGQQAVRQQVTGNPLLALFMAGVAGYAIGWLIHGRWQSRETRVPDHGRTSRGYAPHRDR